MAVEELTLNCKCGKATTFHTDMVGAYNVGDAANETGWKFVFCGFKTTWMCPECHTKAKELMKQVIGLVGRSDFHIHNLLT